MTDVNEKQISAIKTIENNREKDRENGRKKAIYLVETNIIETLLNSKLQEEGLLYLPDINLPSHLFGELNNVSQFFWEGFDNEIETFLKNKKFVNFEVSMGVIKFEE